MRQRGVMVTPAASERAGQEYIAVSHTKKVAKGLKSCSVVPYDPTCSTMRALGGVTLRMFNKLVGIFALENTFFLLSRKRPADSEKGTFLAIAPTLVFEDSVIQKCQGSGCLRRLFLRYLAPRP